MTSSSNAPASPRGTVAEIVDALGDAGLLVGTSGELPATIADLADDSRRVGVNTGFVAVRGQALDGHDWLDAARAAGATLAIVEDPSRTTLPHIIVRDGRRAAAVAAAAFHGWPARELSIVGVTGTNGKTTTVGLLRHLFNQPGHAAASVGTLGVPLADVADRLTHAPQVPGRLERVHSVPTVLRDYAHTPDALDRALRAVRPFTQVAPNASAGTDIVVSRLIVVFGCGGDRDRGKRPEMGRIAEALADIVIVTSDNPRTEDPERILDDIEAGMQRREHTRIVDRRAAIAHALSIAAPHDVVVLAGKGHETYQIRGTTSYPFDEREIVAELSALTGVRR